MCGKNNSLPSGHCGRSLLAAVTPGPWAVRVRFSSFARALLAATLFLLLGASRLNAQGADAGAALLPAQPTRSGAPRPNVPLGPAIDKTWLHPYFRTGLLAKAAERFRLDDFAGAAADFDKAIGKLSARSDERQPARFLLALARMNLGQWTQAAADFVELATDHPLLSDYHTYYAARCFLRAGNNAEALQWARRVSPGAVSDAEAQLVVLEGLERLEQWEALETAAQAFLQKFDSGPRRAEARFRLGTAMEKRRQPAALVVATYRTIWNQAPTELWSQRAEERIAEIAHALPPAQSGSLGRTSAQDWFARATALHEKQQHSAAESAFTEALRLGLEGQAAACQAYFYRAQSVFKQRQRPRAAALYEEAESACRKAEDNDLVVRSLYQGARCRASGGDRTTAIARYAKLEKEFPQSTFADDARLRSAELLQDGGKVAAARTALEQIPKLYPAGDMLGEALFRLAFASYEDQDWDRTHHWLDENIRLIPRETMWFAEGRALYWKARVYQHQSLNTKSRQMYEEAIRQYPLSFYALLSFERLRASFAKVRNQLVHDLHSAQGDEPWPVAFGRSKVYSTVPFARAVELARLGLGADARRELAKVDLDGDSDDGQGTSLRQRALWLTAVLLDRGRVWNASHGVPRYTLTDYKRDYPKGAGAAAWRLSYPRAYPEYVNLHSKENNVPPFLQLAIMREESAFSPTIESFANAIGLTQMLVTTAQGYSETRVTRETLMDPASNIMLGSRFLGHLLEHFGRSVPMAIPGYNAGEVAVERWLRDRGSRPLDEFIELIPFDETRGYVKRVLCTYLTYTWLYGTGDPVPKLSFSLKGAFPKPVAKKPVKRKPAR